MSDRTILVWFRNDLRIHDNEILLEAVRKADKVLPVYCFDPYYFQHTELGAPKQGASGPAFYWRPLPICVKICKVTVPN
jgi:deoxyribodipyrimidine photo-lyase